MQETAHAAYDAYGDRVGWKNFAGQSMPRWSELPPRIRNAWRAAANAITGESGGFEIED